MEFVGNIVQNWNALVNVNLKDMLRVFVEECSNLLTYKVVKCFNRIEHGVRSVIGSVFIGVQVQLSWM